MAGNDTYIDVGLNRQGQKQVKCSQCGETVLKTSWTYHSAIHDPNKSYPCPHCPKVCNRKDAVDDHRLCKHGDTTGQEHLGGVKSHTILKRLNKPILQDDATAELNSHTTKIQNLKAKEASVQASNPGWKPKPSLSFNKLQKRLTDTAEINSIKREPLIALILSQRELEADVDKATANVDEKLEQLGLPDE